MALRTSTRFEGLAAAFKGRANQQSFHDSVASLSGTNFDVTMDTLWQQLSEWSTVKSMDPAVNPLAVVTEYSVALSSISNFDQAMRNYIEFLERINYPYPIEGFRWRLGRPGRYWSVTFPDNWPDYFGEKDLKRIVRVKGLTAELSGLQDQLAHACQEMDQTFLTFAPELSYSPGN